MRFEHLMTRHFQLLNYSTVSIAADVRVVGNFWPTTIMKVQHCITGLLLTLINIPQVFGKVLRRRGGYSGRNVAPLYRWQSLKAEVAFSNKTHGYSIKSSFCFRQKVAAVVVSFCNKRDTKRYYFKSHLYCDAQQVKQRKIIFLITGNSNWSIVLVLKSN